MINITYTLTSELENILNTIEQLRRNILISPITPKGEISLKWEAKIDRLFYFLSMTGVAVSRKQIVRLISGSKVSNLGNIDRLAFNYLKVFNTVRDEWLFSKRAVKTATVFGIVDMLFEGTKITFERGAYASLSDMIKSVLAYLSTKEENPLVEASIISSQVHLLEKLGSGTNAVANILSYLYLYKRGYDARGLLVLEEYLSNNSSQHKEVVQKAKQEESINSYLNFYINGIRENLGDSLKKIENQDYAASQPASFFNISDRQKEIMEMVEEPGVTLTNKKVQKKFKVSQITASRDLSKLASIGLLLPHGKGRSVYYTKI